MTRRQTELMKELLWWFLNAKDGWYPIPEKEEKNGDMLHQLLLVEYRNKRGPQYKLTRLGVSIAREQQKTRRVAVSIIGD
jgi:hypothetical protein